MEPMVFCESPFTDLSLVRTHQEKLEGVHRILRERASGVDRIAVALYDQQTGVLKTFIASPADESPLINYEAVLEEDSSLAEIAETRQSRVIHNLAATSSDTQHARSIVGHGFASSYTCPMYLHGELTGFIFFDSLHKHYFRERVVEHVEIFAHLVSEMIMNDLAAMRALVAALRTAISMVHMRDPETGNHLERMARYSRLIARNLVHAGDCRLDDEQIEQISQFAPLHDIGKIGIPDQILQKPSRLDEFEREVMNTHTRIGSQLVEELINNFGFDRLPYIDYLRNIVMQHHEARDGSGYPNGLSGDEISLEARIVTVSDVFDALSSSRPYKTAWSNAQALSMMELMTLDKLDDKCVSALARGLPEVLTIQQRFAETNH